MTATQIKIEKGKWVQQAFDDYRTESQLRIGELEKEIVKEYCYRSAEAAFAKALSVFVIWPKDTAAPITLYATDRRRGGMYVGYPTTKKNLDKRCTVPIDADDIELGLAVRAMLAQSTISGKPVEM